MKQIIILFCLTAITTLGSAQNRAQILINREAPVVQNHSIVINETPEHIWGILSNVQAWSEWNRKVKDVYFEGELKNGSAFTWKSGSSKIRSKVHTFDQNKSLGWTGKAFGAKAVHIWHFEEVENGTKISVEESMEGWLIALMRNKMNKILKEDMILWLNELKAESESKTLSTMQR